MEIYELEKFCTLIGKKLEKDELYFFIRKSIYNSKQSQANQISEDEEPLLSQKSVENLEIDFFKIMDNLEEFTAESTWSPLITTSKVLSWELKSSNPISIFEFRKYLRSFEIFGDDELEIVINELKYLQSIRANIGVDEVSMLLRDLVVYFPK